MRMRSRRLGAGTRRQGETEDENDAALHEESPNNLLDEDPMITEVGVYRKLQFSNPDGVPDQGRFSALAG